MPEPAITEDQANEAIHQLLADHQAEQHPEVAVEAAPEPQPAETPEQPTDQPVETEPEAPVADAAAPTPGDDDVASLRQRLTEREQKLQEAEQKWKSRLTAIEQRSRESERVLRERYLRKSTAADRALKVLKATRVGDGVSETEVDRVIQEVESTMNPASPSYVPPIQVQESDEDKSIILNQFLNEKQMDDKEANEFGTWIRVEAPSAMSPNEQNLAQRDIDGFLRIAHVRYQESLRTKANKRAETVDAVKSVQRTQKQAARAASSAPASPRKTTVASTPPNTVDFEKVTKDDVAKWLRQSVEQYK